MKKALKSIISLLIMITAFACFNGSISAEEEVWIKSTDYITGIRSSNPNEDTRFYIMKNDNDEIVFCINSKAIAPGENKTTNPQKYFYVGDNKSLSADITKKIPGIISIIKDSKNANIMKNNSGTALTERENYFVSQYALWYYIEDLNGKVVTSNGLAWIKGSRFSNVFNKLMENAKNATSNGVKNPKISIAYKNGDSLTESMSVVEGTTLKMSDTIFTAKFTGTSNNNQDYKVVLPDSDGSKRSYITDEKGKQNYGNNHTFKSNEGFRIIIDTSYASENQKKVTVNFEVSATKKETNDTLKVYSAVNSGLNFQDVALVKSDDVSLKTKYAVKTEIEHKHEIFIKKVNKKGEALAGATLEIYNSKNELVTSIQTTKDKASLKLEAGKYYIKETKAPSGYILSTSKTEFSVDEKGTLKDSKGNTVTEKTISVINDLPTIKIKKINERKVDVKGAKIVICSYDMSTKKEGKCDFEWTTDGKTKELTIGQDFGTIGDSSYIIKETSAPHGYEISEPKYITVKDGKVYGDLEKDTVTMIDNSYLDISKTDITGKKEIEGAKLKIVLDGKVVKEWTSTTKPYRIKGLETNVIYELIETQAPEGYVPLELSVKFRLKEDGKVETLKCEGTDNKKCSVMSTEEKLNIKNDVTKIKISKIDVTNQQELPGATLKILDEKGKPVYQNGKVLEWVSTNKPHYIEMLPVGKYKLVETISPEGYVAVSNEVLFEVKAETGVQTVKFENDVTKVMISKKDFTTGEEIEGATLQILDEKGNVVIQNGEKLEWVSGKEPHYIEKLPVGKYTLVETLPATGYENGMYINGELTSKYTFEVKDNVLQKIDVYNKVIEVPNTSIDVSSTYVIGGTAMIIGLGTITFAKKRKEA